MVRISAIKIVIHIFYKKTFAKTNIYDSLYRYHKGKKVSGSRFKSTIIRESSTSVYYLSRLEIVNCESVDEGEYKAVAKNAHGEANAIVNLNFEGGGKFKYVSLIVSSLVVFLSVQLQILQDTYPSILT